VYSFGSNIVSSIFKGIKDGQLGLGDNVNRLLPVLIPTLSNIKQISSNSESTASHEEHFSLVLNNLGDVYSFGSNFVLNYFKINIKNGQLGQGDLLNRNIPTLLSFVSNITQISAGGSHSIIINNDNKFLSFGSNTVIK
jgi:alpha-tubulin suppressor-like RCC1 family protein